MINSYYHVAILLFIIAFCIQMQTGKIKTHGCPGVKGINRKNPFSIEIEIRLTFTLNFTTVATVSLMEIFVNLVVLHCSYTIV